VVLALDLVERVLEPVVLDAHHDIAEHVDQTPVRVVGEPAVARLLGEALDGLVVETQVQDGVHHARHRDRRARADGDQERVFLVAEALPRFLLDRAPWMLAPRSSCCGAAASRPGCTSGRSRS
jgi:hypothetical protein